MRRCVSDGSTVWSNASMTIDSSSKSRRDNPPANGRVLIENDGQNSRPRDYLQTPALQQRQHIILTPRNQSSLHCLATSRRHSEKTRRLGNSFKSSRPAIVVTSSFGFIRRNGQ